MMDSSNTHQATADQSPDSDQLLRGKRSGVQLENADSLIQSMHDDLLPLAEAIVGYAQILSDDACDRPQDYSDDVEKMLQAAHGLHQFIKHELKPEYGGSDPQQFQRGISKLRHDVGNHFNQVFGFCQLLLLDEDDRFFGTFSADLAKVQEICEQGSVTLLGYKDQTADVSRAERKSADAEQAIAVEKPASTSKLVEPATVLVTDDNPNSRDVMVRILQREGHTVVEASCGREAIEILAQQEFDLVLLDFLMPEMNGYQVLQAIKAEERLRHTPVIIVSALDTIHEVVACIEIGAEDFLNKPVDLRLLRARVNSCLEKKRLREREFAQHFTPELARHFVRHPEILKKGFEAEVSILFCDIRRFSNISEQLAPSVMVDWLSDVMGALSDCVIEHRGVLVDYIGDELMAMWGAPEQQDNHAELACRAAVDMLAVLPQLNEKWKPIIGEETKVGIGINTGMARVGNTGSQRKFKYGPLGNSVNLASRVQGATKHTRTDLLVTGETFRKFGDSFAARRLCTVRVVNIQQPVELFEILIDKSQASFDLKHRYEQALDQFEAGNFRDAASILGTLLVDYPWDGPSLQLMSRVIDALLHVPEAFDPVTELQGK